MSKPDPQLSSPEYQLEIFRSKLKMREILLDKLILAIVLAIFGLITNTWMAGYTHKLDGQLETLKKAYNFERILGEKQLDAHRDIWSRLSSFKAFIANAYSKKIKYNDTLKDVDDRIYTFINDFDNASLYLSEDVAAATSKFIEKDVGELNISWGTDDHISDASWQKFNSATETLLTAFRKAVTAQSKAP